MNAPEFEKLLITARYVDEDAEFAIAVIRRRGPVELRNDTEAAVLFQNLAHTGHAAAQNELGLMYKQGADEWGHKMKR